MWLIDYFRGRDVEMVSRLRREMLEGRINGAAVNRFRPFTEGAIGRARAGRLWLRYRPRLFEYNMMPLLVGRIEETTRGSRLRLRYRAPVGAYVFFPTWFLFLPALMALIYFGDSLFEGGTGEARQMFPPLVILIMLFTPLLGLYLGLRRADAHLEALIEFLHDVGEAEVAGSFRP